MLHVFEIDKSNFSTSQNDKHSGYFDNSNTFQQYDATMCNYSWSFWHAEALKCITWKKKNMLF